MDLSALIFVALAVAWAVYLVPKAVRHHDEVARSRSVDRFSQTLRVLARREAVSSRDSRLVLSPGRPAAAAVVLAKESASAARVEATSPPPAGRPRAARRVGARRRRRVLGLLVVALLTVGVLAAVGVIAWWWIAAPAVVVLAWLVTCRVSVRAERRAPAGLSSPVPLAGGALGEQIDVAREPETPDAGLDAGPGETVGAVDDGALDGAEDTAQVAVVLAAQVADSEDSVAAPAAQGMWDPVPMTLPTYVEKERAQQRTVRTIDLDSTGVWSSGRSASDSALAREAEQAESDAKAEQRRATGS